MPKPKPAADRKALPTVPVLPARDSSVFPGMIHTLHVAREGSRRAIRAAMAKNQPVFVVSQRDRAVEDPRPAELFRIGCLCEPLQAVPLPDGSIRIALRALQRAEAIRYQSAGGHLSASYAEIVEPAAHSDRDEALMRMAIEAFGEVIERGRKVPAEAMESVSHQEAPGALADAIAHHLPIRASQKQELLEEFGPSARLERVYALLAQEQRLLGIQTEIADRVDREFASSQREAYLREQLRTVQIELEAMGCGTAESEELREKLAHAGLPEAAHSRAMQELARLERYPSHSPEGLVIRNYLEWMAALPWSQLSPDRLDVRRAKAILDGAHYGLDQVKDRILDFLAVRQLSQSLRGPILCFVGPPGVGKTSVGASIAEALGREFVRISLGGIRDEAEIRGHRRTYVGALPGRILQSLRQCGTRNPVMLLDEIDKMDADVRGDPSSALLEALDPAQNAHFSDHFLEAPFDLSAVLFIATANLAENIPHALRDRLEIVRFSSYTDEERLEIARRFLLPRQVEANGLAGVDFRLSDTALGRIVREYTREAGVRELERAIATVARKSARRVAELGKTRLRIGNAQLEGVLGPPRYASGGLSGIGQVGVANGLVVTAYGGEAVPIEVATLPSRGHEPALRLTGNLGDVMRESAETALSCVRGLKSVAEASIAPSGDIHVHVPDNAIPKEGPSAGLPIAAALASALTGRPVRAGLAMTGEVTLHGRLMAVGGIREKLIAARRNGAHTVILPAENRADLSSVPSGVVANLQVKLVDTVEEALSFALEPPVRQVAAVVSSGDTGRAKRV